jgi:hypothetical protein
VTLFIVRVFKILNSETCDVSGLDLSPPSAKSHTQKKRKGAAFSVRPVRQYYFPSLGFIQNMKKEGKREERDLRIGTSLCDMLNKIPFYFYFIQDNKLVVVYMNRQSRLN